MSDAAERVVALYDRHAATWDASRGKDALMERQWLQRFTALFAPQAAILDIGCGTGDPMARYLVQNGYAVTGVDSSPAMIARCRARLPDTAFHVADMRTLQLGRRFDAILAWDSFFHLTPDDQVGMFPIFAVHAAPGAALMFTSGPARGEAIGTFAGEALYHGSLDAAEYRACLHEHGFAVVSHMVQDASCGGHTIWLARRTVAAPV